MNSCDLKFGSIVFNLYLKLLNDVLPTMTVVFSIIKSVVKTSLHAHFFHHVFLADLNQLVG